MEKLKTKVRFTSLDVAAMVQNLQKLIGMRATNIYDVNPSTYIIKFAKSEEKSLLLIENGVRFHTVQEKETKKTIPSGFTMRFRKFLRSKRLESIRQVGVQRVVVFTFGNQAFCNHLILELYSQGNIILTDNNYRILQCIRSHEFNEKVKTAMGEIYPFEYAAHIYLENIDVSSENILKFAKLAANPQEDDPKQVGNKKKKKNTKKSTNKLRDIVFKVIPCLFPAVIDNILLASNIDPEQPINPENLDLAESASKIAFKFLKDFLKAEHKGYLYSKQQGTEKSEDMEYFEYSSYQNVIWKKSFPEYEFVTFDKAVNEYYLKYKKSQHQDEEQFEELAWKKFDQIKKDQETRVKRLQEEQEIFKLKAELIEKNIDDVQAIIKIIKTMQDNGYSWDAIQRMVSESRKNGDPLANLIHQLNIHKRQVTVLLEDPTNEENYCELLPVEINIDYNAYTNATMYYSSKKKNFQKELRTKEASQQVLKIAEKDALKVIEKKKNQHFQKNMPARKLFWFEKFYWFISSQGILVISGRDSHQNELLVKRYMKPGDLYMHSDYGGAASTVIKISNKEVGAPRTTLEEAATFTVCRSKAWDSKILSGAWWVFHDQVSKSAPTGQYLPTGSFMIRGKRNYIQPNRMEMGITFLFKIDQQSAKRHQNDRRVYEESIKKQKEEEVVKEKMNEGEQQYAIISLQTTSKVKGPRNQKNQKNKQSEPPEMHKIESNKKKVSEIANESSEGEESDGNSDSDDQVKKFKQNTGKANKKSGNQPQQQPKQKMRNKRKQKKLQKYLEEQDEEQREIIMKMIGAREMKHMKKQEDENEEGKPQNKKGKGKGKNNKKGIQKYIGSRENAETEEKLNPDKVLFLKKKEDVQASEESEDQSIQEGVPTNEPQNTEQSDAKDEPEVKEQELNQENQKKQEEEEIDEKTLDSEIAELFRLVGKVSPEDNIQNLVTMCAPYNSIKQNRFKIKLVPGGLKKGKGARNILHYFTNAYDLAENEKPLIKSVPEQEIINALLGNVKLAGAGLLKMQQKQKAQKKERKKQIERKQKNN